MISVCMATYNGEKFIEEQVRSILSQLGQKDELIVSDDSSSDTTLFLLRRMKDRRIKIFSNTMGKGYIGNFENALMQAKGDAIFLSDQDDVWLPGKVRKVMEDLKAYDFVVTDAAVVDEKLSIISSSHFKIAGTKKGFLNNYLKTRYIGACMAFRRSVLERSLPFPRNRSFCAHDYWIALVAELFFNTYMEPECLLLYRRHGKNASSGGIEKSEAGLVRKVIKRIYCGFHLFLRSTKIRNFK
jgi:glycosyltransferase involved in cell wall biosynthesis